MTGKKELLNQFPQDTSALKATKSAINDLVDSMLRLDAEKEQQKSIFEVSEEKYGVSKEFIKSLAELQYDKLYKESKKAARISQAAELLDVFESEM